MCREESVELLGLRFIVLDPEVHTRKAVDPEKVSRYAELIREGVEFPPIVAFHVVDGCYWVADGYHRVLAYRKVGAEYIEAILHLGGSREAFLAGLSYDDEGAAKTVEDKKACLFKLLADPEWSQWSSRVLALKCGLSKSTVCRFRTPGKRKGMDGKTHSPPKRKRRDTAYHSDFGESSEVSPLIPKVSVRMSPDVRQALRLATVYQQETQYRIVERAIKEYLIKRDYLDADGKLIARKPG